MALGLGGRAAVILEKDIRVCRVLQSPLLYPRTATLCPQGRRYMEVAPHLALWPGLCLTVVVYSLNMFGDAVRDLLDPRLRGRLGRYGTGRDAS